MVPFSLYVTAAPRGLHHMKNWTVGTSIACSFTPVFLFYVKWIYRLYYLVLTKLTLTKGQEA